MTGAVSTTPGINDLVQGRTLSSLGDYMSISSLYLKRAVILLGQRYRIMPTERDEAIDLLNQTQHGWIYATKLCDIHKTIQLNC